MKSNLTKLAMTGAVTLAATASAMAGSATLPGITVGGAAGEPIPPGFYFIDTGTWGSRDQPGGGSKAVGVEAPVLVWSTPWTILGANLQLAVATPAVEVGIQSKAGDLYLDSMFNPYLGGTLAWKLGNGFAFSYTLGGYVATDAQTADPSGVIEQRFALTYLHDGWNFTANAMYGVETSKAVGSAAGFPDYFNLDLTATKTIGKWTVGAVGFYAADVSPNQQLGGLKSSEFALGALAGYNWGPVVTNVFITHDVAQTNLGGSDTRIWGQIVIPLGNPFASSGSSMFHK